jgi:hypothetical protein
MLQPRCLAALVSSEDLVARAKRTDRTDARRRFRAEQAALAAAEPDDTGAPAGVDPAKKSPKGQTVAAAPAQRPSMTTALKAAYRQPHFRDDLRALPVVVTNLGFLGAIGASLAAVVWFVVAYGPALANVPVGPAPNEAVMDVVKTNSLPYYAGSMVLIGPPMMGAFLIGFTAKRASWLGGLIYGIYTVILVVIVLQTEAGRLLTGDGPTEPIIAAAVAWAPLSACLFASALAWYRRFLDLANPNRRRRAAEQSRGKAKQSPARAARR